MNPVVTLKRKLAVARSTYVPLWREFRDAKKVLEAVNALHRAYGIDYETDTWREINGRVGDAYQAMPRWMRPFAALAH